MDCDVQLLLAGSDMSVYTVHACSKDVILPLDALREKL